MTFVGVTSVEYEAWVWRSHEVVFKLKHLETECSKRVAIMQLIHDNDNAFLSEEILKFIVFSPFSP